MDEWSREVHVGNIEMDEKGKKADEVDKEGAARVKTIDEKVREYKYIKEKGGCRERNS